MGVDLSVETREAGWGGGRGCRVGIAGAGVELGVLEGGVLSGCRELDEGSC